MKDIKIEVFVRKWEKGNYVYLIRLIIHGLFD